MTRKSYITRQKINHLLRNAFVFIWVFRYDLKWVSIIGIKWTQWNAWIYCLLSFIWYFMVTCNSTGRWQFTVLFECKINLSLYSSWQVLMQNCTQVIEHFLKTYMCSVIFELFHILENREKNDLFLVTYIFYIQFVPFPNVSIRPNVRPKHMWVYCQMPKK